MALASGTANNLAFPHTSAGPQAIEHTQWEQLGLLSIESLRPNTRLDEASFLVNWPGLGSHTV